jgi:alpha-tubulin suppressor-like RCC1 family protein
MLKGNAKRVGSVGFVLLAIVFMLFLIDRQPVVEEPAAAKWAQVSAGYYLSLAFKRDGTFWGWGNNGFGQLGLGNTTSQITPVKVGSDADWKQVAAGGSFNIAIKTDGTLWSWGDNAAGQLGLSDTRDRSAPNQIEKYILFYKI